MKEIRSNPQYEKSIERALNKALKLVEAVYDEWEKLGLDPCQNTNDLYSLIAAPDIMYREAIHKAQRPEGLKE